MVRNIKGLLLIMVIVCFGLLVVNTAVLEACSLKVSDFKLNYESGPSKDNKVGYSVEVLADKRIKIVNRTMDGGCVTRKLAIKSVSAGDIKIVDVLETHNGAPCKGIFFGEIIADLQVPVSGKYIIRYWFKESFRSQPERLLWQKEVVIN